MTYTVIRCPECFNTGRRDNRRVRLKCNFCGLLFAEADGIVSYRKTSRGPVKRYERAPNRSGSGHIAPPCRIGRGLRWWV